MRNAGTFLWISNFYLNLKRSSMKQRFELIGMLWFISNLQREWKYTKKFRNFALNTHRNEVGIQILFEKAPHCRTQQDFTMNKISQYYGNSTIHEKKSSLKFIETFLPVPYIKLLDNCLTSWITDVKSDNFRVNSAGWCISS